VLPAQRLGIVSHITVLKEEWQVVPGLDDPEREGVFADPRTIFEAGIKKLINQ